ncbi:MAG: tyrosine-type recombinase/integrase [Deltaproteobacteria bacterium]|nr:tyrosine-type recombinase/integrase [Deltaproteobacteria bacterium]
MKDNYQSAFHRGCLANTWKNNLLRNLKVCYKIIGIADADIHSLRHTFCTQLARKNVPVQKIMRLGGHLDIETTMIYVKSGWLDWQVWSWISLIC